MTVKWHPTAATTAIRTAAFRGVRKATEIVRREWVRLVVETPKTGKIYGTHQASAPGEPPASDTGRYLQSINTTFDETEIKGYVNASAEHALPLEIGTPKMQPRPAARPALENKRAEVTAVIREEVRKAK